MHDSATLGDALWCQSDPRKRAISCPSHHLIVYTVITRLLLQQNGNKHQRLVRRPDFAGGFFLTQKTDTILRVPRVNHPTHLPLRIFFSFSLSIFLRSLCRISFTTFRSQSPPPRRLSFLNTFSQHLWWCFVLTYPSSLPCA